MPEFQFNVEMVAEVTVVADNVDDARKKLGDVVDNAEIKFPGAEGRIYTVDDDEGPELISIDGFAPPDEQ